MKAITTIIRTAVSTDLPAIAAVDASEYGSDAYTRFFYRQAHDLWPSLLVVAEVDGAVAGYALGALSETPGEGWLLAMVVAPGARRLGVGRALVATILDRFRERVRARVLLTVHPSNESAIGLYQSFGFEGVGHEDDYFGPDEPRRLFALALDGSRS